MLCDGEAEINCYKLTFGNGDWVCCVNFCVVSGADQKHKTQITFAHLHISFTAWCNFGMPFGRPLAPVPFSTIDGSVKGEFFSPSSKVRLKPSVVRHNIFTCSGTSLPLSMLLILFAAKGLGDIVVPRAPKNSITCW